MPNVQKSESPHVRFSRSWRSSIRMASSPIGGVRRCFLHHRGMESADAVGAYFPRHHAVLLEVKYLAQIPLAHAEHPAHPLSLSLAD